MGHLGLKAGAGNLSDQRDNLRDINVVITQLPLLLSQMAVSLPELVRERKEDDSVCVLRFVG